MADHKIKSNANLEQIKELITRLKQQYEDSKTTSSMNPLDKNDSSLDIGAIFSEDYSLPRSDIIHQYSSQDYRSKNLIFDNNSQKVQTSIKGFFNVKKKQSDAVNSNNKVLDMLNILKNSTEECSPNSNSVTEGDGKTRLNTNTKNANGKRLNIYSNVHKQSDVSDIFNIVDVKDVNRYKGNFNVLNIAKNNVKSFQEKDFVIKNDTANKASEKKEKSTIHSKNYHFRLHKVNLSKDKILGPSKPLENITNSRRIDAIKFSTKKSIKLLQQEKVLNLKRKNEPENMGNKIKANCKRSFDDFCESISKGIVNNSANTENSIVRQKSKNRESNNKKHHFFPKSHSIGFITKEGMRSHSCEQLNSLPVTCNEIKSRKERVEKNKITLDDFVEKIMKNINNSNQIDITNQESQMHFNGDDSQNKNDLTIKSNEEEKTPELSLENNCAEDRNQNTSVMPEECNIFCKYNLENSLSSVDHIGHNNQINNKTSDRIICSNNTSQNCKKGHSQYNDFVSHCLKTPVANNLHSLENSPNIKVTNAKSENEETESIDFLTYLPPNWNPNSPVCKEKPLGKVLLETRYSTIDFDCKDTGSQQFALQLEELHQRNALRDILEKSQNLTSCNSMVEEFNTMDQCCDYYAGIGTESTEYYNISSGYKYTNSVKTDETLCKSVNTQKASEYLNNSQVSEVRQIYKTNNKQESEEMGFLDQFFEDLLKEYTSVTHIEKNAIVTQEKKCSIKRYRKGKTKIYRIRKLKKKVSKSEAKKKVDEESNFDDLFLKLTQSNVQIGNDFSRSKSLSSVSTSSSYITDATTSEVLSTGSNELTSPQQRLRKGINELSKNKSLLCSGEDWENVSEHHKEELKMKIQEIFLRIADDFAKTHQSSLKIRRQNFDNCIFKEERLQLKPEIESAVTVINSTAQRSQAKFKLILYIMKKVQTLLETNTKLTKRELYYQLKTVITDQRVVDRALNAVSCLLDVGMWTLNIIAQKGLVFGNLKILLSSGETLNCSIPGTLIPPDINDIVELQSVAYFILVVEKESIFHKLIEEGLPNKLTRPFIMITGKGFPDLNTQLFLKKLWVIMSIPVFILVDADPHGINIMLNYRFGSVNNAHVSHCLAVPNAKWLGVYPSEVTNFNLTREHLSERELRLVSHLLQMPHVQHNPRIVEELNVLLEKQYKAEIEGLIKSDSYLSEIYLPNKFFTHNFI